MIDEQRPGLEPHEAARLREVADLLIPEAHGMPSAATVLDDQAISFVLGARPDLMSPLRASLRSDLPADPNQRLRSLDDEPEALAALQLAVVAGYYADTEVRRLIGYPGQIARPVDPLEFPEYVSEGLVDVVLERGPIWRDPAAAGDPSGGQQ